MTTDEKLLNIIISIKKVYKCFLYDEFEEVDCLISKINYLLDETIIDNIGYLKNVNTKVFTDEKYFSESFKNNKYRKYIEKNINNAKVKDIKLNYDLIIKYIEEDYEIFNYLENVTKNQILELGKINPNILLLLNNITDELLIKLLGNNYLTSLVIDGNILESDIEYKNSYIYLHKQDYLRNSKICNLYINGLKKYLDSDIFDYIHLSDFARNNVELAKYVLNINPKLLVYTGDNIKNNKEIMIKMIELDSSNKYYLSEQLKEELK